MSVESLRDEFVESLARGSEAATLFGSVVGVALVLAPVSAAIAWSAGRWGGVALVLSGVVLIAAIYTLVEVLRALSLARSSFGEAHAAARWVVAAKSIELLLFTCAIAFLAYSILA